MNVVHGIENYVFTSKSILTIGTFDGVHLGHQKIIQKLVKKARDQKLQANLLTFFPHPRMVLQKEASIRLIDTLAEKEQLLRKLGIDINQLGISSLFIGYDHRFGKNREATVEDLISYGKTYNFQVTMIPAQDIASITVSSTKIRNAIGASDFEKVQKFLGRPYELNGKVTQGAGVGRTLGFPTANLNVKETYKLIPPRGVYLVQVQYKGKLHSGMMNIGNRPTLNGNHQTLEVHLFDFEQTLYDQKLQVFFLKKTRDEIKFNSLEELKSQLKKDQEICKRTLAEQG